MIETVTFTDIPIPQGADWSPPDLARAFSPDCVRLSGCNIIDACSGQVLPFSSLQQEDYTGCTGIMKLRAGTPTGLVLATLSTANGYLTLSGGTVTRHLPASVTATLPVGTVIGQIDITRPNGVVERQYEITCAVTAGGNS